MSQDVVAVCVGRVKMYWIKLLLWYEKLAHILWSIDTHTPDATQANRQEGLLYCKSYFQSQNKLLCITFLNR